MSGAERGAYPPVNEVIGAWLREWRDAKDDPDELAFSLMGTLEREGYAIEARGGG